MARAQDGGETSETTSQTGETPTTDTSTDDAKQAGTDTDTGAAGVVPEPGIASGLNETGAAGGPGGAAVPEMNVSVSGGAQVSRQGETAQPQRDSHQGEEKEDVGGQTSTPPTPPQSRHFSRRLLLLRAIACLPRKTRKPLSG